jgi:hypothetical protein
LLAQPRFDAAWEDKVAEEVAILRSLQEPGAPEPALVDRIRERYVEEIIAAPNADQAVAIYQRGLGYGDLPEAEAHLRERLGNQVIALLDAPVLETAWMDALDHAFGRLEALFPNSTQAASLRMETADVLQAELNASLAAERFEAARRALEFLEIYSSAPEAVAALRTSVEAAERQYLAREDAVARQAALGSFRAELAAALSGPCLDFEPSRAAAVFGRWTARQPGFEKPGRAQVGAHVARCLPQVQTLDRERALALKQRSEQLFGPLPGLERFRDDPCGADYLVGSGSQGGRRGSRHHVRDDPPGGELG